MSATTAIDDEIDEDSTSYPIFKSGSEWPSLPNSPKPDASMASGSGDDRVNKWIQEQLLQEEDKHQYICFVCGEGLRSTNQVQSTCGHQYCTNCIVDLFEFAIYDEPSFPPQCCGELIPLAGVYRLFTPEFQRIFREKQAEFRASDRIYCHNQQCLQLQRCHTGEGRLRSLLQRNLY